MFRLFLFLLITFLSSAAFPQDTVNQVNTLGKKQGFWRKHDSLGRLVYEGYFKDGSPIGTFRYYYPSGEIKTISTLSENARHASVVTYFQNGQKMASGIYLNEKKESIWRFFSEKDGSLVSEESYQSGVKNGYSKVFFPEGGLADSTWYRKGKMDGWSEQYYSDGKLKVQTFYRNGEKNDTFHTYYMTGQIMSSGQYINDHPSGRWFYYTEKGEVIRTEDY